MSPQSTFSTVEWALAGMVHEVKVEVVSSVEQNATDNFDVIFRKEMVCHI